ncbi:MAG TPA: GNAT family N-acetyltransferase [Polyangiaceae bacterium]|nr:GNAT family N-acetyltransferase [Polyangiaceae bacterium]
MASNITLRPARSGELEAINHIYESIAFEPSTPADHILVAESNGHFAGQGRLVHFDPHTVEMGGIYVDPRFRGAGVARALVSTLLEKAQGSTIYCLPFVHLTDFYCSFGFVKLDDLRGAPEAIQSKLRRCGTTQKNDVDVLIIRAPAGETEK